MTLQSNELTLVPCFPSRSGTRGQAAAAAAAAAKGGRKREASPPALIQRRDGGFTQLSEGIEVTAEGILAGCGDQGAASRHREGSFLDWGSGPALNIMLLHSAAPLSRHKS
ncbi:hypothetical protein EYF80_016744 [Liparis tanakae]|uniref:Uncharacterized protein n=1 Tax=Liparis tanakae TaxID=230148 RepID=A0A4Z2I6X5_9TELE|nr:hypothetical protein EYF80_016744 [Liparis tanakae]